MKKDISRVSPTISNKPPEKKPVASLLGVTTRGRFKKVLMATDNHGHYICPQTRKAFLQFMQDWKPDIKIHLGDNFDFAALRTGATPSERGENLLHDLEHGVRFLEEFSPHYWLWGNHDDRLLRYLGEMAKVSAEEERPSKAATSLEEVGALSLLREIKSLVKEKGIQERRWGVEEGVLRLGKESFVHGYCNGLYATKKTAETFGQVCHGHNHTADVFYITSHEHAVAFCVPSLCDNTKLDYQRGQLAKMKHCSGWGLGILDEKTGAFYHGLAVKIGNGFFIQEPKVI